MKGWTYILRCADGSYYVGSTTYLEARVWQHNEGLGATYTARRRPVELVWAAEFESIAAAFGFEKQVQNWSRAKREALIDGRFRDLPELARGRTGRPDVGSRQGRPPEVARPPDVGSLQARPPEVARPQERAGRMTPVVESVPQHCPTARELDDLELLLTGAYAPRDRYDEPGAGPITIDLPAPPPVELVDPEGLPLVRVEADGSLTGLAAHVTGPFRDMYDGPERTRAEHGEAVAFVVAGPMTTGDLAVVREARGDQPVLLLALAGHGTPQGVSQVGLLRATLAAAELAGDTTVVAVPFPSHGDPEADHALAQEVVATYADDVRGLPGTGDLPAEVAEVVAQDQPALDERGLVVFFTGLSGSGKSTIARALHDRLLEDGRRTVTSLDGDVVRRHLSAGLGFSKQDRETNILRIGWVAAEIARHRGVAICSPIAPFDATRRQVREYVDDAAGALFLVHVATPLEECERRDKKGLYAKARRGEIPEFTGISSPYEEPEDADLRVDTTGRSVDEVLADVLDALGAADLLHMERP